MALYNYDQGMSGIYRAILLRSSSDPNARVYIPSILNNSIPCPVYNDGTINETIYQQNINGYPIATFCNFELSSSSAFAIPCWVTFETGNINYPIIIGYFANSWFPGAINLALSGNFTNRYLDRNFDINTFISLDILNGVPKLTIDQIKAILQNTEFSNSKSELSKFDIDTTSKDLYTVQTNSNMSVLISLAIAALETGWTKYVSAKNNYWNFGHNSSGWDLHYFDNFTTPGECFDKYHNELIKQYYNQRGLKTLATIGPTYSSNSWATSVGACAKTCINAIPDELMKTNFINANANDKGYVWPTPSCNIITSLFGYRTSPGGIGSTNHEGIDIGASLNSEIVATKSGIVVINDFDSDGYGNYIKIKHDNPGESSEEYSLYAHMIKLSTCVVNTHVEVGQVIGYVGSTGASTGPHLHFEIRPNNKPQNPLDFVSKPAN